MKRILGICAVLMALIALTVPSWRRTPMTIAGKAIATMRTRRIITAMGTASGKLAYRPRTSNGSTATIRAGRDIVAPTTGMKWQAWKSACGM
jgi:hypothetical protein